VSRVRSRDVGLAGGVSDHGALTGLTDDDHVGYAAVAGRVAGQLLAGSSTGASAHTLTLKGSVDDADGVVLDTVGFPSLRPTSDVAVILGDIGFHFAQVLADSFAAADRALSIESYRVTDGAGFPVTIRGGSAQGGTPQVGGNLSLGGGAGASGGASGVVELNTTMRPDVFPGVDLGSGPLAFNDVFAWNIFGPDGNSVKLQAGAANPVGPDSGKSVTIQATDATGAGSSIGGSISMLPGAPTGAGAHGEVFFDDAGTAYAVYPATPNLLSLGKVSSDWANVIGRIHRAADDQAVTLRTFRVTSGSGGAVSIQAADGLTSGSGGAITLLAGASTGTGGAGGAITATAGVGAASAVGGVVTLAGGAGGTGSSGGAATLRGGAGNGAGTGGVANLTAGAGGASGVGGAATVSGGAAGTGTGGPATLVGGNGASSGAGGAVFLTGGSATTGTANGGAITLQAGTGASTGSGGAISITAGTAGGTGPSSGGAVTIVAAASRGATGGSVTITAGGITSGNGMGGSINLNAGNGGGTNQDGGIITLTPGLATGSGVPGVVRAAGPLRALAGTSSAYARVGGTLDSQFADVGNVGVGEDDLHSYTVPASVLAVDGQTIRYRGVFAVKSTGGALKQVRVKFGATTVFDTSTFLPVTDADGRFVVEGAITRTAAGTQRAAFTGDSGQGASAPKRFSYTTPAETLSGTVVLKATGESSGGGEANDDVVQNLSLVEFVG
jgi:hypothetical protein